MKNILFALVLAYTSTLFADSSHDDPFKNISLHKFKNGLKVILAPDPKSEFVQIKVNVGVGFVHEDATNYGVSHLLEHVLFRNEKLKDDMSYLQLIKEKDGNANGTTGWDRTSYYATVKKNDANWIMETLHEMIMKPSMSAKHVETEKKTVLLEIGDPSPLTRAIGIDVIKTITPSYFDKNDFWKEYFNVKIKSNYSPTEEQLSTLRLNQQQVFDHYKKFYDPSNMQIILSGNFNKDAALARLIDLWSGHTSRNIGDQRPKYEPELPKKSYLSYNVTSTTPRITLGYLVSNISVREKEVLFSYTEFLSHRLMKKLRNVHGETYTAHDYSHVRQNFGYVGVTLQSSKDKFQANFDTIQEMMQNETVEGKLSDADIEEAKRLYLNRFVHWSQNASGSGKMAERMFEMNEYEGIWETPFEILETVTPQQYRLILQKFAQHQLKYEDIKQPNIFFYQDTTLLIILSCLIAFYLFRRVLTGPFKNDDVRWVRKVRFPPLKMMEGIVGVLIFVACAHSFLLYDKLDSSFFTSLGVYAEYISIPMCIFIMVATAQAVISYFPRKIYLVKDTLVIKSLSYFSKRIHKKQIKTVKVMSLFNVMTSPKIWLHVWNSFHYYDLKFWRPGMLIELNSGKMYFFSTKDSHACVKELSGLLVEEKEVVFDEKEAA